MPITLKTVVTLPSTPGTLVASTVANPISVSGGGTVSVSAKRVSILDPAPAEGETVSILSQPTNGYAVVRPDNLIALVLTESDATGADSLQYRKTDGATTSDQTVGLNITLPSLAGGWGLGNHYMLATDANDDLVIEHGDNHRKLYISNGPDGLTKADIATAEGLTEGDITDAWLAANPQYGGSESLPLHENTIDDDTFRSDVIENDSSSWIFLKRGYEYTKDWWGTATRGESDLHPRLITSWGTGDRPIITTESKTIQQPAEKIVVQDVEMRGGVDVLISRNIIFDRVRIAAKQFSILGPDVAPAGWTIRKSELVDIIREAPSNVDYWSAYDDRTAATYLKGIDGLLLDGNLLHHSGWGEGYTGSAADPQPPSKFSHNYYVQRDTSDMTARNNLIAQAASVGAQFRAGGFAENNVFLDNNVACGWGPGDGTLGNFALMIDTVITSAGHKTTPWDSNYVGAVDWGLRDETVDGAYSRNIIAHSSDPNNPNEISFKGTSNSEPVVSLNTTFFNDTLAYNWNGFNSNVEGLSPAALDQVTIQNFTTGELGITPTTASADMGTYYKSGLIYDFMDYARANWQDSPTIARDIVDYFQSGFGISARPSGNTSHAFAPSDIADGVRWDNRLNWNTGEVPASGHTVDLRGCRVRTFATFNGTINLNGGHLTIIGGKISGSIVGPGTVLVGYAGQCDATLSGGATRIDGTAPTITGTPSITGTVAVGQTISVDTSSVSATGTPTPEITGTLIVNNNDVGGTYTLTAADEGESVVAKAVAKNGVPHDPAAESTAVTVAP